MTIVSLEETTSWKIARTRAAREAAAGAWVRRGQAETGSEHLAVLDDRANLICTACSGRTASVMVGDLPRGSNVVLHHSHPDEASLSGADLLAAWNRTPMSEVRAYTPDGGVFRGRSLVAPRLWMRKRQNAIEAVGSELRVLGRRRRARLTDATAHLVNAELAEAGSIWYRFTLSRAARTVLDQIVDERLMLQAIIRNALSSKDA